MSETKKKEYIIIAPHCDDEIIGLFEIISNPAINPIIIYTEPTIKSRQEESTKLKEYFPNIKVQMFMKNIPQHFLNENSILFFPDPIYEHHPAHRLQGCIGEQFLRNNLNVVFYSINMMAPYCHEVKNFKEKEKALNEVYPSQKQLWENEKKWILFEGRIMWLMNNVEWR